MYVTATRLLDGRQLALDQATDLRVGASLDCPAMSMSGVFPVAEHPGRLGEVRVYADGRLLCLGRVDRQCLRVSAGGVVLEIEARSKGALLLDNEAQPCLLTGLYLGTLFGRVAAPYGFALYNPNPAYLLPSYTIRKDVSEWESLCGFTRRAWGITPYVEGDTIFVQKPVPGSALKLSNTGNGVRFTALEEHYTPYNMVSRVVLRDSLGSYSASVSNSAAAYHGVQRTRYVIPANEFVDVPGLDANQRIRHSMLDSEGVAATVPGLLDIKPGQGVEVDDKTLTAYNLVVRELEWRCSAAGLVTRLWLDNWIYY